MATSRSILLVGMVCVLGSTVFAASPQSPEASGVIRDPNWKIQILSSAQARTVVQAAAPRPEPPAPASAGPTLQAQANAPLKVPADAPKDSEEPKKLQEAPSEAAEHPVTAVVVPTMTYAEAYNAVPFRRNEYDANPGYRHETALELMFQTLRPTTVVKQYTPRLERYPDFYQYPYARFPYMRNDVYNYGGIMGIPYNVYSTR